MDVKGLKLRDVVSHIDDITINRMLFELDNIYFYAGELSAKLENVEINKGLYIKDIPISDKEYKRFMCPVCYIQADVGNKGKNGIINGVIRPSMFMDNEFGSIPETSQANIQKFHFYYENLEEKLLGLSSIYTKTHLLVQLVNWRAEDYAKFKKEQIEQIPLWNPRSRVPADFEVNVESPSVPYKLISGEFRQKI